MLSTRCTWFRQRLALLSGDDFGMDLTVEHRRRIERHLVQCPSCRLELEALTTSVTALRSVAKESYPLRDTTSLWPAISLQICRSRHRRFGFFMRPTAKVWLGLAASFLGLGLLLGLIGWSLGSASALRNQQANNDVIKARPALPAESSGSNSAENPSSLVSRVSLDVESKPNTSSDTSRDPQKSQ
jgi:hypothetical protein